MNSSSVNFRYALQPYESDRTSISKRTISILGSTMLIEIGQVEAIFRYPVKSMAGEPLEVANLGWHGLDGDRRLAFRRMNDRSGFPWLSAGKLPDLVRFVPHRRENDGQDNPPTHVRTPDGEDLRILGDDLAADVGRRYGAPVQ